MVTAAAIPETYTLGLPAAMFFRKVTPATGQGLLYLQSDFEDYSLLKYHAM
jgi:hypothetical protein